MLTSRSLGVPDLLWAGHESIVAQGIRPTILEVIQHFHIEGKQVCLLSECWLLSHIDLVCLGQPMYFQ